ncbi:hypothetical protein E2C01_047479 [Portunus trituberculatus]|uniref:Uncharacterized protein n=1 Tax=Portunus trituberculatus TaxID=210409 RepID=A0A5B7GAL8_PORTR|nr:hypothetical protein [Portunus trituberculatus]
MFKQNSCGRVTGTTSTSTPSNPSWASGPPPTARQGERRWSSHTSNWAAPSPPTCSPYIANTFPPQCSTCNVTLSVEYILLHCMRYREQRRPLAACCQSHGLPLTQNTLLGDEHPDVVDRLMIYLTETNLTREL